MSQAEKNHLEWDSTHYIRPFTLHRWVGETLLISPATALAAHLNSLVGKEEQVWRTIEETIAKRQPKEYDRAVELLTDLRDLAARTGNTEAVTQKIRQLRERHAAKTTLIERLERAGLTGDECAGRPLRR